MFTIIVALRLLWSLHLNFYGYVYNMYINHIKHKFVSVIIWLNMSPMLETLFKTLCLQVWFGFYYKCTKLVNTSIHPSRFSYSISIWFQVLYLLVLSCFDNFNLFLGQTILLKFVHGLFLQIVHYWNILHSPWKDCLKTFVHSSHLCKYAMRNLWRFLLCFAFA